MITCVDDCCMKDYAYEKFVLMNAGNWIQFGKNDELKSFGQPYDYGSIMHYGPKYFAKNRKVYTIRARDPSIHIGQRDELSEFDIRKLNILYNCDQSKYSTKKNFDRIQ